MRLAANAASSGNLIQRQTPRRATMMRRAVLAIVLAACGGDGGTGPGLVDSPTADPDAPNGCVVSVSFEPTKPIAGGSVRLKALVTGAGPIQGYAWTVQRGATMYPTQNALDDGSEVTFVATDPGTYGAQVVVTNSGPFCFAGQAMVEVKQPGAGEESFRFHVLAPAGNPRPPYDDLAIVQGGPSDSLDHDLVLAEGALRSGTVVDSAGAPVAAYMRFAPVLQRDAAVEAYAGTNGAYSARLRDDTHEVLVIPERSTGLAPRRFAWQPGTTSFTVDAASTITGQVRVAATPLAGANVQLKIDGVPTTIGTSDANGNFAVRGTPVSGALVVVEVTPPATRGLARLTASSTTLDVSKPVTIVYTGLAERDLAGTTVRRGGVALPNAAVSIVGKIASAATISTGSGPVTAAGEVRVGAVANAAGVLPQLRAPAAPLSAVVAATPGDLALTAVDLTATVPATITAAPMLAVTTASQFPANTALGGVTLDAVPAGDLALAGVPTVRATSNVSGQISLSLAAGASYDLRFVDPEGRAAPLVRTGVASSAVGAANILKARTLVGALVSDGTQPIRGALVQILCASCTGLERTRPIAEGVTGIDGRFSLAVPDPSTP